MMHPSVAYTLMLSTALVFASAKELLADDSRSTTTAKERLASKAADPQRLNDCKVPKAKQDSNHPRPDDCAHLQSPQKVKPEPRN